MTATQQLQQAEGQEAAPNILALDLATKVGFASCWRGVIESGTKEFKQNRDESPGMRWLRFGRWLSELCLNGQGEPLYDLIVWEQAIVGGQRSANAARVAFGLATRVEEFCARHGIGHASVHLATLKKWATGSGRANKLDMMRAARKKWPEEGLSEENQCDARHLLDYAMSEIAPTGEVAGG